MVKDAKKQFEKPVSKHDGHSISERYGTYTDQEMCRAKRELLRTHTPSELEATAECLAGLVSCGAMSPKVLANLAEHSESFLKVISSHRELLRLRLKPERITIEGSPLAFAMAESNKDFAMIVAADYSLASLRQEAEEYHGSGSLTIRHEERVLGHVAVASFLEAARAVMDAKDWRIKEIVVPLTEYFTGKKGVTEKSLYQIAKEEVDNDAYDNGE